ncbi:MAG: hypothetical protein Q7S95_01290 [bacterium]|nr:hypothetical protein [bacterium]
MQQHMTLAPIDTSVEKWGELAYSSAAAKALLNAGLKKLDWTLEESGWEQTSDPKHGTSSYDSHRDYERLSGFQLGGFGQIGGIATHDTYHAEKSPTGSNWSDDSSSIRVSITDSPVQILVPSYGGKDISIIVGGQEHINLSGSTTHTFGGSEGGVTWKGSVKTTFTFEEVAPAGQPDLAKSGDQILSLLNQPRADLGSAVNMFLHQPQQPVLDPYGGKG